MMRRFVCVLYGVVGGMQFVSMVEAAGKHHAREAVMCCVLGIGDSLVAWIASSPTPGETRS